MFVVSFTVSGTALFASTNGQGVFLSANNGTSWTAEDNGLTNLAVWSLALRGTNLFAGTSEGGVWRRPLSELMTDVVGSEHLPISFGLEQNYPNPFNPSTTIKYELPKSSEVRLSVYDMLGREVAVLVNRREHAGVHQTKFNASNLASGVYLCRLQAEDFLQSRKLMILR